MASEYPAKLDPQPPLLRSQVDTVTNEVVEHLLDMIKAVQTTLGTRPGDLSALAGGLDQGNVAQAIFQLSRVKMGTYGPTSLTGSGQLKDLEISLDSRFTIPPFIVLQTHQPRSGNEVVRFLPRNVTKESFQLALSPNWSVSTTFPMTVEFDWLAIEPPFGVENIE